MQKSIITRNYEGVDVHFKEINGVSSVRIDEVARFCGWTKIAKSGNEVIRWSRVNEHLKELGVSTCGHGDFIPEYIMYPLIGKAKNERATQFMLWVGQVLVELRQSGCVILDNADDEVIDYKKKYGIYRIRKTFTNTDNPIKEYETYEKLSKKECKAKHITGEERIKGHKIVFDTLSKRLNEGKCDMKGSEMLAIQELLTDVSRDITKISNNVNGGYKTANTKESKRLLARIEELENKVNEEVPLDEYIELPVHLFSNNYLYTYEDNVVHKSNSYKGWIYNFPKDLVEDEAYWEDKGVDWFADIKVDVKVICKPEFDIENGLKAFQDMVFNNIMCIDDNIISKISVERIATCNNYKDGKIYYHISNV